MGRELKIIFDRFHWETQHGFRLRLKLQMSSDPIRNVDDTFFGCSHSKCSWFTMDFNVDIIVWWLRRFNASTIPSSHFQQTPRISTKAQMDQPAEGRKWNKMNENILVYLNEPYHHWNIVVNKLEGANHIIILISNVRIMELVSRE